MSSPAPQLFHGIFFTQKTHDFRQHYIWEGFWIKPPQFGEYKFTLFESLCFTAPRRVKKRVNGPEYPEPLHK